MWWPTFRPCQEIIGEKWFCETSFRIWSFVERKKRPPPSHMVYLSDIPVLLFLTGCTWERSPLFSRFQTKSMRIWRWRCSKTSTWWRPVSSYKPSGWPSPKYPSRSGKTTRPCELRECLCQFELPRKDGLFLLWGEYDKRVSGSMHSFYQLLEFSSRFLSVSGKQRKQNWWSKFRHKRWLRKRLKQKGRRPSLVGLTCQSRLLCRSHRRRPGARTFSLQNLSFSGQIIAD